MGVLVTLLFQSLFGQRCDVCSSTNGFDMYQLQAKSLQAEVAVAQRLLAECREGKPPVPQIPIEAATVQLRDTKQTKEHGGYLMGLVIFLVDVGLLYFCLHHIMSDESKYDAQKWFVGVLQPLISGSTRSLQQQGLLQQPAGLASPSASCQHFEIGTPRGRSRQGHTEEHTCQILSQQVVLAMASAASICVLRILEILAGTGLLGHFVRYLAITARVCLLVLLVLF